MKAFCFMFLLFICLLILGSLWGCSTTQNLTEITGNTLIASAEIDELQDELAVYATQSETMAELETLQLEILAALHGDIDITKVFTFYARSKVVYAKVYTEVQDNWELFSPEQQEQLQTLNTHLLDIELSIQELLTQVDSNQYAAIGRDILIYGYYAMKVFSAYQTTTGG